MLNKKCYPFERNNYFFGKLMTVRDFEDEQRYGNDKRRLANRVLHGAGIVSGLDCILVDDQTISLEPGLAIDYSGREIVVDEPVVKKLGVINGFEDIRDKDECFLCLRYSEELKDASFSAMDQGEDKSRWGHVGEGYELYFTDAVPDPDTLSVRGLTTVRRTVFKSESLHIQLEAPRFVRPGGKLTVRMRYEKVGLPSAVSFNFALSDPLLKTPEGDAALRIAYNESETATNITYSQDYEMLCDAVGEAYMPFRLKAQDFRLRIGDREIGIAQDIELNLEVITTPLQEKVTQLYYARHFDEIMRAEETQTIYLARMHIISKQTSYFADGFVKHPFRQYLLSTELLGTLVGLEGGASEQALPDLAPVALENTQSNASLLDEMRSGVEVISLGFAPKADMVYYSEEFVHGLGVGPVAVQVAVENTIDLIHTRQTALIFGDPTLFDQESMDAPLPKMQLGAMINVERGTMRIALRLEGRTDYQSVPVRWWVFRSSIDLRDSEELLLSDHVRVSIAPSTVIVSPRESVRLTATVSGSASQEVAWSVVDAGGGQIDINGLYTAPAKEGAYEIVAESVKFPDKRATAYIVVRAGDSEA